jgi:hypothetical protein
VQKTSAHNVAPVTSRFVALSTSNSPLAQTVGNESDGVAKAASVRMISIPADSGSPYKTFDSVPKGCKDIPAAIVKLKSAMRVQHGTVARAFITQLVKERAEGELLLKQKIAELMSAFLKKAGNPTDGAAHRVAEWFALFHAANTLALEWEVLPKGWKHDYVSTIYRRYLDAAAKLDPKPPLNFLAEYAREHDLPSFLANDSTSSKKRATALAEKGFIDKGPEGGRVMVLPASFRSSPLALPALHAAKAIGALATDGGKGRTLQAKRTIAGKSVRCFVVQLHVVKAELKTLSTRR